MKRIHPRTRIQASFRLPGSKSITHRALIAASLAKGESLLLGALSCEDTNYTRTILKNLGSGIKERAEGLEIRGTAGKFRTFSQEKRFFLGNSGTSMRLLLSVVSLGTGEFMLDGTPRMRQRPVGELARALNRLGGEVSFCQSDGYPPLLVKAAGLKGGKVRILASESSQYVSSLLLAAPYAEKGVEIEIEGTLMSRPYVDMTLEVMKSFGADIMRDGYHWFRVTPGKGYLGRRFVVEGDMSSAAYFWAAAAVTRGEVVTGPVDPRTTSQGDIGFLDVLKEMGCSVMKNQDSVAVQGRPLRGVDVDMSLMPDMVPTLAAVGLFAEGKTVIRNVAHLRLKESDRLGSIAQEWRKLGANVEELPDGLIIKGGHRLEGNIVDPQNDHRIAMSLAVVGLRVPGVLITNETCVNKSFPNFWEYWDRL
ncbi:MAG: 3-phosphoshikimate 1-carboxyvinyltransferase [Deltaproteobacteria bacterium]|nr:3-phosphoshikimate 1-carboxyvinyltransferase [Deltaproteobacteria bacterium]MBW2129823.1 3-phosphoshikimate 1-carboxyvinyltransferase [Deltaproteobacteria bacterium]MBW2304904.1 3-phosphoshikimate 1-carboxyvinyltransferase [Deltaproteobacteria bacterium]